MKRLTSLLLCLSLTLALTACSLTLSQPPFPPDLPRLLLESETFSEPLESLDSEIVWMLYGLDESGLSYNQLSDAQTYRSSGATCEELCVLTLTDEAAAQTAIDALGSYISDQIQSNREYRPAEIPKLEKAILSHQGCTVVLIVANNYDAAARILNP